MKSLTLWMLVALSGLTQAESFDHSHQSWTHLLDGYLALRARWLSHNPADQRRIRQGVGLDYLDYDWRLNEAR
jgi:hypothetical protein